MAPKKNRGRLRSKKPVEESQETPKPELTRPVLRKRNLVTEMPEESDYSSEEDEAVSTASKSLEAVEIKNGEADAESEKENEQSLSDTNSSAKKIRSSSYNLRNLSTTSESSVRYKTRRSSMFYTTLRANPNTPKLKTKQKLISSAVTNFKHKSNISKDQKRIWKEESQDILNVSWKICYLSTMYSFQYHINNLRRNYENVLGDRISKEYRTPDLKVKLSTTSCLSQNSAIVDMVIIKVTSLVIADLIEEQEYETVYEGRLVRSDLTQSTKLDDQEWFPLMLSSGKGVIHNVVIGWLQASFGCYVTPKFLPQTSMMWLACLYSRVQCKNLSHLSIEKQDIIFTLLMEIPDKTVLKNFPKNSDKCKITATFSLIGVAKMWEKVTTTPDEQLNIKNIAKFMESMEDVLFLILQLPPEFLTLKQMTTPCMTLSRDGKIKMTCTNKFASIIRHLVEVFQATCNISILQQEEELIQDSPNEDDEEH